MDMIGIVAVLVVVAGLWLLDSLRFHRASESLMSCLESESMARRVYQREAIGHHTRVGRLEALLKAKGIEVPPVMTDEIIGRIPEDYHR